MIGIREGIPLGGTTYSSLIDIISLIFAFLVSPINFIANHLGNIEIEMNKEQEGFVFKNFNFSEITKYRQSWGNFRDRRPDLYKNICDF